MQRVRIDSCRQHVEKEGADPRLLFCSEIYLEMIIILLSIFDGEVHAVEAEIEVVNALVGDFLFVRRDIPAVKSI